MHTAQRFVDNNPRSLDGPISHILPQSDRSVSRSGVPQVHTWGDGQQRNVILHSSESRLEELRVIYHPGFNVEIEYPRNPDRTLNFFHGAYRGFDITRTKTLTSNIPVLDLQRWEDVTVTEIWEGGGRKLSELTDFLESLHLFRVTPPPLGRHVSWLPFDRGYAKYLIQPLELRVGDEEIDIREVRENYWTNLGAYADLTITWTFALKRPARLVDSLIVAEGA